MPTALKKPRILVVEDVTIVARDLALQLVELGYEPVGHATRGEEAIRLAGELRPDLVLMDIQLAGGMDGITAAQALHDRYFLPVVFLTAFAEDDTIARAMETDPFGYILKPFSDRELRMVLTMALHKHKTESRLRESEAHYRALVQSIGDGIISTDSAGTIVGWNAGAEHLFGYTADEVLGQPTLQLLPARYHDEHRTGIARMQASNGLHPPTTIVEREGRRKDGSEFPLAISVSQWVVAEGKFFTAVIRDLTSHKQAQSRLAQLHERNELILDSAAEGIIGLDMQGNHTFVNPAASSMLGYAVEELLGQNSHRIWHHTRPDGSPYPETDCPIYAACQDGKMHRVSTEVFWRKDGRPLAVEYASRPIFDQGRITGAVVTFTDITERRQSEQEKATLESQLRQSQKLEAIGQLAGGIAHDFNNLLTGILGNASLLQDGLTTSPDLQQEMLQQISEAGNRAASLTRQLLLFSRREEPQRHDFDLSQVVADMVKILQRILGESIELQLNYAAEPLVLHADSGMMDQVLLNLAVNARDAMPGGGPLAISTEAVTWAVEAGSSRLIRPSPVDPASGPGPLGAEAPAIETSHPQAYAGDFACLTVADRGCGMSPEVCARIFEPFFTTKESGRGTGLGLATVYGTVQVHQGWVEVESQPGVGSTFRVYLPRLQGTAAATTEAPAAPAEAAGTGETILIVEDEASVRTMLGILLKRAGYRVLECSSGAAALDLWPAHRTEVRLLITDMVMPGGVSGMQLAERLHADRPDLRVIFISGYSTVLDHDLQRLGIGADFLNKPFVLEEMLARVRAQLKARTAVPG